MSKITKAVVTFLRDRRDLIRDNDCDALYPVAYKTRRSTGGMMKEIDPLNYLTNIPQYYLYHTNWIPAGGIV